MIYKIFFIIGLTFLANISLSKSETKEPTLIHYTISESFWDELKRLVKLTYQVDDATKRVQAPSYYGLNIQNSNVVGYEFYISNNHFFKDVNDYSNACIVYSVLNKPEMPAVPDLIDKGLLHIITPVAKLLAAPVEATSGGLTNGLLTLRPGRDPVVLKFYKSQQKISSGGNYPAYSTKYLSEGRWRSHSVEVYVSCLTRDTQHIQKHAGNFLYLNPVTFEASPGIFGGTVIENGKNKLNAIKLGLRQRKEMALKK